VVWRLCNEPDGVVPLMSALVYRFGAARMAPDSAASVGLSDPTSLVPGQARDPCPRARGAWRAEARRELRTSVKVSHQSSPCMLVNHVPRGAMQIGHQAPSLGRRRQPAWREKSARSSTGRVSYCSQAASRAEPLCPLEVKTGGRGEHRS
jgi:hypothetical protein